MSKTIAYNIIQLILFAFLWGILLKYNIKPISWDSLWIMIIIMFISLNDKHLGN